MKYDATSKTITILLAPIKYRLSIFIAPSVSKLKINGIPTASRHDQIAFEKSMRDLHPPGPPPLEPVSTKINIEHNTNEVDI